MPKYSEKLGKSKSSTLTLPSFHETETLLKDAEPQQVPLIVLRLLRQLGDKVELHVHFIVNSVVVGNNVNGSDISVTSLGHTPLGNNSNRDGQIHKM